jgi:hypothetical protein
MAERKRILLIQLYSNGDCLYATTIAQQIKQDHPNCILQWMILQPLASILKDNPFVDELVLMDKTNGEEGEATYNRANAIATQRIADQLTDVFYFTQLLWDNLSNYDGCIRRSIYRGYDKEITVDKTPILVLDEAENNAVNAFVQTHNLTSYKHVILFETSPLSGQVLLSEEDIIHIASSITSLPNTCIILSSYKSFNVQAANAFDGSVLSIRETVGLTHFCNLLIGCSSGITWGSLSTAGKQLPMIQLLSADAYYYNPPSIDFAFSGIEQKELIELFHFAPKDLIDAVKKIVEVDFESAKKKFHQTAKNKFAMHRGIVHHLLKRGKFGLLKKFLKINFSTNGAAFQMSKMIAKGFFFFPFQLIWNRFKKK